jgi:glucose-1-phosphate cytidylyltransferase
MKVVILAGGAGTRLSEETDKIPKPMVQIGNIPILKHIMNIYMRYGWNEFVICLGYKGHEIKEYFYNYYMRNANIMTIRMRDFSVDYHHYVAEDFKITLVDTGLNTLTAERVKQIKKYTDSEPFFLTYGDGVSDVNLQELLKFHQSHKKIATVTAIQTAGRFGHLSILHNNKVDAFNEKPVSDYINGGFFVAQPSIFKYLNNNVALEDTLSILAKKNELMAYKHRGFWKAMDTLRDKAELEEMWRSQQSWEKKI